MTEPWKLRQIGPARFLAGALVFELSLTPVAIALGSLVGHQPLEACAWRPIDLAWGAAASVPMLGVALLAMRSHWRPLAELRELAESTLAPLFADASVLYLALLSVAAGLGEELLFRGLVEGAVAERTGVAWLGLLVANGLFAVVHWLTTAYAALAGLVGLYLSAVWHVRANLLVAIAAHSCYDFLALVYLTRRHKFRRTHQPT